MGAPSPACLACEELMTYYTPHSVKFVGGVCEQLAVAVLVACWEYDAIDAGAGRIYGSGPMCDRWLSGARVGW